jgi:dipeptidyl-peptidase III
MDSGCAVSASMVAFGEAVRSSWPVMLRAALIAISSFALLACAKPDRAPAPPPEAVAVEAAEVEPFVYQTEQFGDVRILRYQVPGFDELPLQQKQLVYYLYQAALSGRDIIWDQNYRHNLAVRRTLEAIVRSHDSSHDDTEWPKLLEYTKRVWFSNGIHHHYSMKKIEPGFSPEYFAQRVASVEPSALPLQEGETPEALVAKLSPVIFDPAVDPKRVSLDASTDLVLSSATNYYDPTLRQKEVERFYAKKADKKNPRPVSHGLNSKLVKEKGKLVEKTWKVDGMYGEAIGEVVGWLKKAVEVAESEPQRKALELLVEYYETGDLAKFDEYSIAWVADTESRVDVVNGFIEVYGDPLGYRGAYESVVSFRDLEASKRIEAIGQQAQWFEDNSPIADAHKKKDVQGISAKVITVVVESGDAAPSTPIGINLPNANWIRAEHGSKSVNLGNIVHAYDESRRAGGVLEEFAATPEEIERAKKWGDISDALHTDMHEVIGHASGRIVDGVGTPKETLKSYASTLEEGRADLVALYYMVDPKLIEIGVMSDLDAGRAAYDNFMRNGLLVQLARLELGEDLEESHMRNRQMIAKWVLEKGAEKNVVELTKRDGKSYVLIHDYEALRSLFGQLLREVQRIKSEGDYAAGKALVETYGVKVDPDLHQEVLRRYAALDIAPYAGFIQPRLVAQMDGETITDVKVEYPDDFMTQMLEYAETHSFLPTYN